MNESDEYNFDTAENSNLSSLFGKESSIDKGNSNLTYKAPKQPANAEYKDTKPLSTRFYYKYIILYEIIAENEREVGKYIIGLLSSEVNGSEILIYQNKRNILIRGGINTGSVSKCSKKFSLTLLISGQKWLLEFMNKGDYTEFGSEFSKLGGTIGINSVASDQREVQPEEKTHLQLSFNCSELDSSILDTTQKANNSLKDGPFNNSNSKDTESKRDKEEILARLAKIGLPRLPSFHKESGNNTLNNDTNAEDGTKKFTKDEAINERSNSNRAEEQYSTQNNRQIVNLQRDIAPFTAKGNAYRLQENNYNIGEATNQIQTLNTNMQIDPINLLLVENRITNTELKQHMSLLNRKLDLITNFKDSDEHGVEVQLKSKIKALQIKTENLEDELNRCQCRCNKLEKINVDLSCKLENMQKLGGQTTFTIKKENSSQTDFIEKKLDSEDEGYKLQLTELLKFIECLPLKSVEFDLTQLQSIRDGMIDKELWSNFDTCINFLQEIICSQKNDLDNIDEMRNNFIRATKKIMFDLYSAVNSSFSEDSDMKSILAEQVRNVTAQLVRNFDKSIQNKKQLLDVS